MTTSKDVSNFRIAAGALAVAVLVQAALAGQFISSTSEGAMSMHRVIGELLGLVALVVAVAAYRLRAVDRDRWWLGLALVVMVVAQIGLGFAGRESSVAAGLHVPLGVATFGVALAGALPRLRS